jgi:hypothetical protein
MSAEPGWKRFNAPHRLELGWLTVDHLLTITFPGTVAITSSSVVTRAVPAPAILRVGITADNGDAFYVSLRTAAVTRPASYDTELPAPWVNKVHSPRHAHDASLSSTTTTSTTTTTSSSSRLRCSPMVLASAALLLAVPTGCSSRCSRCWCCHCSVCCGVTVIVHTPSHALGRCTCTACSRPWAVAPVAPPPAWWHAWAWGKRSTFPQPAWASFSPPWTPPATPGWCISWEAPSSPHSPRVRLLGWALCALCRANCATRTYRTTVPPGANHVLFCLHVCAKFALVCACVTAFRVCAVCGCCASRPASTIAEVGRAFVLSVATSNLACSLATCTRQWFLGPVAVPGATTTTLMYTASAPGDLSFTFTVVSAAGSSMDAHAHAARTRAGRWAERINVCVPLPCCLALVGLTHCVHCSHSG